MDTFGLSLAQAYLILALVPGTGSGTGFFKLPGTGFSGTDDGTDLVICYSAPLGLLFLLVYRNESFVVHHHYIITCTCTSQECYGVKQ